MPGVAESAVVGLPHPDFGEGVIVVVAKAGTMLDDDAIVAALKGKIANFKVPKRVFIAADLPRNAMGKGAEEPAAAGARETVRIIDSHPPCRSLIVHR